MTTALEIRNLEFSYGSNAPVLNIPELQIKRGERVFIYGPSGCGKTTLLGLIAGVLDLQVGSIRVLDQNLEASTPHDRDLLRGSKMGYIFQMFNLLPFLNVYENIVLPCQLNNERLKRVGSDLKSAVFDLSARLGIKDLLVQQVTDLSVGQQQRVAAARALLGNPELIIADEPTSSLDSERRQEFLQVLLDQAALSHATVLFVSHDRELSRLFERSLSIPELNRSLQQHQSHSLDKNSGKKN